MIDQDTLHELAENLQKVIDAAQQDLEQFGEALRQMWAPFTESLRQAIEEIKTGAIYTPRQKLPRPPKYAGPQNKGRSWDRQPPRQARSHCRKYRR